MCVGRQFFFHPRGVAEEAVGTAIPEGGEEELLVGLEAQGVLDDTVVHGLHGCRTFRDNHCISTVLGGVFGTAVRIAAAALDGFAFVLNLVFNVLNTLSGPIFSLAFSGFNALDNNTSLTIIIYG